MSSRRFRSLLVSPLLLVLALPALLGVDAPQAQSPADRAVAASVPPSIANAPLGSTVADFADPFILRDGSSYVAFATGAHGKNVQIARSTDLNAWTALPDALPALPSWAARDSQGLTWAPSVLRRTGKYVLYYTVPDSVSGFQCISRAVADALEGPYVDDSSKPFVCDAQLCGAIDPSPFVDESGRAYLLWKSDENAVRCRGASRLWAQPLAADGLGVTDSPTVLLTMDRAWERPLVEGPSMIMRDGRYFLFYSANWYESADYAVGYATCTRPLGPCEKKTLDAPLLRSNGGMLGPGGQEFFEDANGATWMAFHAWSAPATSYAGGGARALRVARLTFADGVPRLAR